MHRLPPTLAVLKATMLACLGCLAPAQREHTAGRLTTMEEALPGLVAERMHRANLPGVAIVLVQGQRVLYARGFGRKNLAYADPVTPESVFRVASLTKQFVAFSILMLEHEGRLSLDDPVVKHVPWFRTRDGGHEAITIGQLLSHQSGLPRGPYYAGRHGTTEEQVRDLRRMHLVHEPGSAFKYSNTGYNLAGFVVESVAGTSFPEFVEKRILKPLGMRADFSLPPELGNHYATGYMTDHYRSWVTPTEELRAAPLYPAPTAAGQLFASALDVSLFLRSFLHEGRAGDGQLLPPEQFRRMLEPFDGEVSSYGLGMGTGRLWGRTVFQHTGGYFGHSSLVIGLPEQELGGVVLINRASSHHENRLILHTALALLLGEEPPELRGDPALAGLYRAGDFKVEVLARGDRLFWLEEGRVFPLEPVYGSTRRYVLGGGRFARWPADFDERRVVLGPNVLWRQGYHESAARSEELARIRDWQRYVGIYRDDDFGDVHVFVRDKKLYWAFSPAEQVELRPTGEHRFVITGGSFPAEPVTFELDDRGAVVRMKAAYMEFVRLP